MGYNAHIEKINGQPISLDEWSRAVQSTPDVRLNPGAVTATNPTTGERIQVTVGDGGVDVCVRKTRPSECEWEHAFRYRRGRVTFSLTESMTNDPSDPVRKAASRLSAALAAKVVGDEGETYEWSAP